MSYILDALRKADAQRESDPARGIHAQPVPPTMGGPRRDGIPMGFWLAGTAGLLAMAVGGWYLVNREQPGAASVALLPPRAEVAVGAPTPAPDPAIAAPVVEAPASAVLPPPPPVFVPPRVAARPAAVAPSRDAPAPVAPQPAPAPVAPQPAPAPVAQQPGPAPVATTRQRRASARVAAEAARAASETNAAPPAAAVAEAAPISGLPADAPKLAISGGVYSANTAQRMLIVNGQVFNEGGEIGPGVVLEEIKPRAAVLKYRGSRYTVAY